MDGALVLLIGTQVVVYAMTFCGIMYLRKRLRRRRESRRSSLREVLIENSPLLEHRIDAATREADEAGQPCTCCGFTNFKRFRFCLLCGEVLRQTILTATPSTRYHRLARARKRREWTRQIDTDGSVSWSRDSKLTGSVDAQFPAIMPQLNRLTAQVISSQDVGNAEQTSISVGTKLARELTSVSLTLMNAMETSATTFLGQNAVSDPDTRMKESIALSVKDFPSKYAHFVVCASALVTPVDSLDFRVHRDYLVEESVEYVSCMTQREVQSSLRIVFLNENGIDAGALHREWFVLLNEKLVESPVALFTCTNAADQTYYINTNARRIRGAEDNLAYFYAAGRLVGRALVEGEVLSFHLALPLLKIILGLPVNFSDLEYLDPDAYKSMLWILEHDGIDALGLDFSVSEMSDSGEFVTVDLIPNGREMTVTDANKHQYLQRRFQYLLFESVASELRVFVQGIYEIMPLHLLMLFDPEEFDYILSGTDEIDVDDWERHSNTSSNLKRSRVRRWFWDVVRSMPNEYRRRLLQFATGCARVPLVGFKGLTSSDGRICLFTLKGVPCDTSEPYIRSHACFNRLDLPMYASRADLKTVLYATLNTDLYGFTTQ